MARQSATVVGPCLDISNLKRKWTNMILMSFRKCHSFFWRYFIFRCNTSHGWADPTACFAALSAASLDRQLIVNCSSPPSVACRYVLYHPPTRFRSGASDVNVSPLLGVAATRNVRHSPRTGRAFQEEHQHCPSFPNNET